MSEAGKLANLRCDRCTSNQHGLGSSALCICGPNVPCGWCGQGIHPVTSMATRTEWGLVVITREGVALIPQTEICPSLEAAEERARQERSFGMNVYIARRQVTEWEPM